MMPTLVRCGFEVQRFRIIPYGMDELHGPCVSKWGPGKWQKNGDLWVPTSRFISGWNLHIDLAQIELIKRWRVIQGSVRQIQDIAVGSGTADPTRTDTALGFELDSKNIDVWEDTFISPDSVGLSTVKAQVVWLSLEANGTMSEIGLKFDDGSLVTHALFKKMVITGITQANPAVVTVSAPHGLSTGDEVRIEGVVGMTEVNDRDFVITVVDADEFSLDGEDSTAHTAYTSGGNAFLVVVKTVGEVVQTNYVMTYDS